MCRLAMLNKDGFNKLDKEYGVINFMDYLEKQNGGHGNGFLLVKDGAIVYSLKSVKLTNEEIYKEVTSREFDWFLYHTRITSQGTTNDEQCHPFITKDLDFALMMNGTEHKYGDIGKLIGTNDTDALFRVYHSLNINLSTLKNLSSRFMGFKDGKVWFTNPSARYNGLQIMKGKKNEIVVASSFPKEIKCDSVKLDYYWEEGKKIKKEEIIKQNINSYRDYTNNTNWYNNYTKQTSWYDDYKKKIINDDKHLIEVWTCNKCGSMYRNELDECQYDCGELTIERDLLTAREYDEYDTFFVD